MFHVLACFILTVGFMAFENGYKVAKEEHNAATLNMLHCITMYKPNINIVNTTSIIIYFKQPSAHVLYVCILLCGVRWCDVTRLVFVLINFTIYISGDDIRLWMRSQRSCYARYKKRPSGDAATNQTARMAYVLKRLSFLDVRMNTTVKRQIIGSRGQQVLL